MSREAKACFSGSPEVVSWVFRTSGVGSEGEESRRGGWFVPGPIRAAVPVLIEVKLPRKELLDRGLELVFIHISSCQNIFLSKRPPRLFVLITVESYTNKVGRLRTMHLTGE